MSDKGQRLDASVRAYFEPRFGHDFSRVRVHTGSQAAASARSERARAYTVGENIVFGSGRYASGTEAGRSLLAHELAHVVQQTRASQGPALPSYGLVHASASAEGAARIAAARALNGQRTSLSAQPLSLARDDEASKPKQLTFSKVLRLLDSEWTWTASKESDPHQAGVALSYQSLTPTLLQRTEARGISLAQGLFLLAQSLIEEIANSRHPERSDYRIFNMMPTDPEFAYWKSILSPENLARFLREKNSEAVAWNKRGIRVELFNSVEEKKEGGQEIRRSPFFEYESLEIAVDHLLNRLSGDDKGWYNIGVTDQSPFAKTQRADIAARRKRYTEAKILELLKRKDAKVADYGRALRSIGYATASDYTQQVNNRYLKVLGDFIQMIEDAQKNTEIRVGVHSPESIAAYESLEGYRRELLAAKARTKKM